MNGGGVDNQIHFWINVFGPLAKLYERAALLEASGEVGRSGVGTAHGKPRLQKDGGKTAHANAADPDKVDPNGVRKINLIHGRTSF